MDNLHTLHWFEFAEDNLDSAKTLMKYNPRDINTICYLSQQSVEKNLKGYLVNNGIDKPPYTHDLSKLKEMCEDFDQDFSKMSDQCDRLNPYGVQIRYPDEIEVEESDAHQAIADAEAVNTFEPIIAARLAMKADYDANYNRAVVTTIANSNSETNHTL
jgi:HEPN domain-containing protein